MVFQSSLTNTLMPDGTPLDPDQVNAQNAVGSSSSSWTDPNSTYDINSVSRLAGVRISRKRLRCALFSLIAYNANRGRTLLAPEKPMSQRKTIPDQKVSQGKRCSTSSKNRLTLPVPLPNEQITLNASVR